MTWTPEWIAEPNVSTQLIRADDGAYYKKIMCSYWFECEDHGLLVPQRGELYMCRGQDGSTHEVLPSSAFVRIMSNDPEALAEEVAFTMKIDPRNLRGRREVILGRVVRILD